MGIMGEDRYSKIHCKYIQKKYIYATMSSWHQQTLIHLKITCTCMLKRSEVVPENKINGTVWNIHVSIHKLYVNDLPKNIFATICLWTVAMLFLKQRHCFGTFMNPFISFICYYLVRSPKKKFVTICLRIIFFLSILHLTGTFCMCTYTLLKILI
jgi:hypothetical protein